MKERNLVVVVADDDDDLFPMPPATEKRRETFSVDGSKWTGRQQVRAVQPPQPMYLDG